MMDWKQRKILVLGARSRGLATARYLLDSGAEVYLSDPGIQLEEVSGLSRQAGHLFQLNARIRQVDLGPAIQQIAGRCQAS